MNTTNTLCALSGVLCFLVQCTTYDSQPSAEELQRRENAENFTSLDGDLTLDEEGNYAFKGETLQPTADINGMPSYQNIKIGGQDYTTLSAGYDTSRSLYFLNPQMQIADIGTSLPIIDNQADVTALTFSGKYNQQTLSDGSFSPTYSGAIVLNYDPDLGTLSSVYGPEVEYQWDNANGQFTGTNGTSGTTIITNTQEALGNYQTQPDQNSETFGVFWAIGE